MARKHRIKNKETATQWVARQSGVAILSPEVAEKAFDEGLFMNPTYLAEMRSASRGPSNLVDKKIGTILEKKKIEEAQRKAQEAAVNPPLRHPRVGGEVNTKTIMVNG